ncbi:phage portal protein [Wolbachia endosymbiont (group A) of Andrena hattorfiana]
MNDWYGLSPIEAAAYSIDQYNQAGAWNQAMLQNGARPSGAIVVKSAKDGSGGSLSQEQYQRLKEQINDHYSGSVNAGRPILLEGGLEWKEMSLSPRDMDFIESKHSSARDIALAFGVPPQLLGIPGDNTYSKLVEARLIPLGTDGFTNARKYYLSPEFLANTKIWRGSVLVVRQRCNRNSHGKEAKVVEIRRKRKLYDTQ